MNPKNESLLLLKLAVLRATLIHFHCIVDDNLIYIANISAYWLHSSGLSNPNCSLWQISRLRCWYLALTTVEENMNPPPPQILKTWMRSNFTWCLLWEFFRPRLKHVQKGERKQKMRVLESQSTAKRYNTYYRCDRKAPYLVVSSSALYPARKKGEDLKVKKCWSESVWQSTRLKKTERDSYLLPTLSLIYRV